MGAALLAPMTGPATAQTATPAPGAPAAATLTERQIDNLVAFARLYGYVRYFHASDGSFDTNWAALASDGVGKVIGAAGADELLAALDSMFTPIAPTLRLHLTGRPAPPMAFVRAEDPAAPIYGVAAWRHEGRGVGADASGPFSSSRVVFPVTDAQGRASVPDPNAPFCADLGGGVSCAMPISAMVSVKTKTVPAGAPYRGAAPSSLFDRDARLGSVVIAWSAVRQFWPYFGERDTDWDGALREALPAAAGASARTIVVALRAMMARLGDGQADAYLSGDSGERRLPIEWRWVEGQLVITRATDEAAQGSVGTWISTGACVTAIGGVPTMDAMRAAERLASGATPDAARERALRDMLVGGGNERVEIRITPAFVSPTRPVVVELTRSAPLGDPAPTAADLVREPEPGLLVVRAEGSTVATLHELRQRLAGATHIVFDMRSAAPISSLMGSMVDSAMQASPMGTPVLMRPDQEELSFELESAVIVPQVPSVRARVAFVADARTIGLAERDLITAREAKIGPIVGTTTAGTAGDVTDVALLAGLRVVFTGRMARLGEGEPLMGVGLAPDVEVAPTIAGVAAGRDEVLERAIRVVKALPERAARPPAR